MVCCNKYSMCHFFFFLSYVPTVCRLIIYFIAIAMFGRYFTRITTAHLICMAIQFLGVDATCPDSSILDTLLLNSNTYSFI